MAADWSWFVQGPDDGHAHSFGLSVNVKDARAELVGHAGLTANAARELLALFAIAGGTRLDFELPNGDQLTLTRSIRLFVTPDRKDHMAYPYTDDDEED